MPLPTREELNPIDDDLDGRSALEHFLGKSLDEVEAMFRDNSNVYGEDLMWMGPVAFRFYVQAAIRYLRGDSGARDCSFAAWFVIVLESRLEYEPLELRPIAQQLGEFCEEVVENGDRFGERIDTYGDVKSKYKEVQRALSRMLAG